MQKIPILLVPLVLLCVSVSAFAQLTSIEKIFQSNLKKYSMEHFAEGEDATSGTDYLFYKRGPQIVKVRSIWSSSNDVQLRVEDLFFDKALVLFRRSRGSRKHLRTVVKGKIAPLTTEEEYHFVDGKLARWMFNSVDVPKTDPRWDQTEKDILREAELSVENYRFLKENK